jgi:hypothetical protein
MATKGYRKHNYIPQIHVETKYKIKSLQYNSPIAVCQLAKTLFHKSRKQDFGNGNLIFFLVNFD